MRTYVLAAALVAVSACLEALAVPVTFEFAGHVTSITGNGAQLLGNDVVVGDRFQGTYTFESTLTDSSPADPHYGRYDSTTSVMHVAIGALELWSDAQNVIQIYSFDTYDELGLGSFDFASAGLRVSAMIVHLSDSAGSALSSDQLPAFVPLLHVYTARTLQIEASFLEGDTTVGFTLQGLIDVPEPLVSSMLLLGTPFVTNRRHLLRRTGVRSNEGGSLLVR